MRSFKWDSGAQRRGEEGGVIKESAGKPGSVVDDHSSGMCVTAHLKRPTRERMRAARRGRGRLFPYLVLLRVGFSVPRHVTTRAVRSYRTFSPLPAPCGA